MKKVKIIICSLLFALSSGVIIYFSIPKNLSTINMAGSSGVSPLATSLANKYSNADVVVQAGGSGLGIDVALTGKKDIGMASKTPILPSDPLFSKDWKDKEMKTITVAWDGMGIVYKPPTFINDNFKLDINLNTLPWIYLAFAGFEEVSWNKMTNTFVGPLGKINPYARDGGSQKSGTADAFYKNSNIAWKESTSVSLTTQQKKLIDDALENGNYGRNTKKTAEANSQAWDFFKTENTPGSMIYLSSGFILQNSKEIKDQGFKIATYNGTSLEKDAITKSYNWYRPLNFMVSIPRINNEIKKFIEWTLEVNQNMIIENEGYIFLTLEQKKSMSDLDNNFWTSDWVLKTSGANNG